MKKNLKRWLSMLLTASLLLAMSVPAFADEPGSALEQIPPDSVQEDIEKQEQNELEDKDLETAIQDAAVSKDEESEEEATIEKPKKAAARAAATDTTIVLYSNGTLVINELPEDRGTNTSAYGSVTIETSSSSFNENGGIDPPWRQSTWKKNLIKSVKFGSLTQPTSMQDWFRDCSNLSSFDSTNLDTSKVKDFSGLFASTGGSARSFSIKGLESWDTSSAETTSSMFESSYFEVPQDSFANWNLSKLTDASRMFYFYRSDEKNIGEISLPAGCNLTEFFASAYNIAATVKMQGAPSAFDSVFFGCGGNGEITLIPSNAEAKVWCKKMVALYGPAGTKSVANLHLPAEPMTTVLYADGTMIINEMESDRASNLKEHGAVLAETDPLDAENQDNPPWRTVEVFAENAKFIYLGSPVIAKTMAEWFSGFTKLELFDSENLNASNAPNMTGMFRNTGIESEEGLEVIGMKNWQTYSHSERITSYMFAGAKVSAIDDLSGWMIGEADSMFEGIVGTLDAGTINLYYGKSFKNFAADAENLITVLKIYAIPSNYENAFFNAATGKTGDITLTYESYASDDVKDWCQQMVDLYGASGTETQGEVHLPYAKKTVLYEDGTLILNELSRDSTANIEKHGAVRKEFSAWDGVENDYVFGNTGVPWFNYRYDITAVEVGSKISPVDTSKWFFDCTTATTAELSKLDMSQVTNADQMFYNFGGNAAEKDIVISGLETWDTGKLKNMHGMFMWVGQFARSVTITGFTNWDTSSAEDTSEMFEFAGRSAKAVNLSGFDGWNTGKIKATAKMFYGLGYDAESVSLSGFENWDTASLEDAGSMFEQCASSDKQEVVMNLSKWDISNVTNMRNMFACFRISAEKVTLLGLDHWKFNSNAILSGMFDMLGITGSTPSVSEYNIGTLTIPGGCVTDNMFQGAHNVKGTLKLDGMPVSEYGGDINLAWRANTAGGALYLAPTDDETFAFAEETVSKYGPTGSESQGNVYLLKMFDFTVSESIMMTGTANSADLEVTDLTVENLGSKAITVSSIEMGSVLNGWSAVAAITDFKNLAKDSKEFSLVIGGFDLSKGAYTAGGSISTNNQKVFNLTGKTGAVSTAINKQQVANLVVTVMAAE
ncbi:BspA family leucine-rich repeat surface protein [Anaerovoracaceae bacterium 41-7]